MGNTQLHLAASEGHLIFFHFIMKRKKFKDGIGRTPPDNNACSNKHLKISYFLIELMRITCSS